MAGSAFFLGVIFIGTAFFGFGSLMVLRYSHAGWNESDAAALRLALELSVFAVVMALAPSRRIMCWAAKR